ncbi:leucine zipper domain-containing protein [Streptomyces sp. 378]|uniref:helix-turn-helix domain-containing protein n=1 Tax=Streptomyces sp. 378 TaxID=3049412 RepID=UPI0024C3054F|nr:leucine zipper domain-containing protein [Streptomyces sp. 378]MDK1348178.1 leucine zipper domain-containing protein [Streptomyces sp. 378]
MSHRNARLTVHGRRLLVERVCAGRPVAHVAAEMGISRATAHKWVRRWRAEGEAPQPRSGTRWPGVRPRPSPSAAAGPETASAPRPGCRSRPVARGMLVAVTAVRHSRVPRRPTRDAPPAARGEARGIR